VIQRDQRTFTTKDTKILIGSYCRGATIEMKLSRFSSTLFIFVLFVFFVVKTLGPHYW
jgi:hypothetical protein